MTLQLSADLTGEGSVCFEKALLKHLADDDDDANEETEEEEEKEEKDGFELYHRYFARYCLMHEKANLGGGQSRGPEAEKKMRRILFNGHSDSPPAFFSTTNTGVSFLNFMRTNNVGEGVKLLVPNVFICSRRI